MMSNLAKIMFHKNLKIIFLSGILFVLLIACKSLPNQLTESNNPYIILYSKTEHINNTLLQLMEKAHEPYSKYIDEVTGVLSKIESLYKYTLTVMDTELIIAQWDILLSNNEGEGLLINDYFILWKKKNTLDAKSIAIGVGNVNIGISNILAYEKKLIEELESSQTK